MDKIEQSLNHFFQRLGHTPGPWQVKPNRHNLPIQVHSYVSTPPFICEPDNQDNINSAIADARLIAQAPAMLRTLCRTYLWMLTNLSHRGHTTFGETIRLWAQTTLVDLRHQISEATGIADQEVQDSFEQYALWIHLGVDVDIATLPDDFNNSIDPPDPEKKIWSAMQEGSEDFDDRP